MERIPVITREPIKRVPMTWADLREPIFLDDPTKLYPVWGFENLYEMDMLGNIKKLRTGEFIKLYDCRNGKMVCLFHPDGDGSTLTANLDDVWSSTFLGDKALAKYNYLDNIK